MASYFQKPQDLERWRQSDATTTQRVRLHKATGLCTRPFYIDKDRANHKLGNKDGDVCLPDRRTGETLNIPWLSMALAHEMIEKLGEWNAPNAEGIAEVRAELLKMSKGNPDFSKPKSVKSEDFRKFWEQAQAAGFAAAEAAEQAQKAEAAEKGVPVKEEMGFVITNVSPATIGFARWLKQEGLAEHDEVHKGVSATVRMPFHKAKAYSDAVVDTLRKLDTGATGIRTVAKAFTQAQIDAIRGVATTVA